MDLTSLLIQLTNQYSFNIQFCQVQAARDEMQWGEEGPPPLLVKIAPDLSKQDLEDIAAVSTYFFSHQFFQSNRL